MDTHQVQLANETSRAAALEGALRALVAWHDGPLGPEPVDEIRVARALLAESTPKEPNDVDS